MKLLALLPRLLIVTVRRATAAFLTKAGLFVVVAIFATLLTLGQPAGAWLPYRTNGGALMRWSASARLRPIPFNVDQTGLPVQGLAASRLAVLMTEAFAAWSNVRCPPDERPLGIRFGFQGLHPPTPIGVSCDRPSLTTCPAYHPNGNQLRIVKTLEEWPFSDYVGAMTLLTARSQTGELIDVDIVLNAVKQSFCDATCDADQLPIKAVLLHEAGHFIGLDHSLDDDAFMAVQPVIDVVHPVALRADDRAGACATVPAGPRPADPLATVGVVGGGGGGCEAGWGLRSGVRRGRSSGGRGWRGWAAVVAAWLTAYSLLWRRRRLARVEVSRRLPR